MTATLLAALAPGLLLGGTQAQTPADPPVSKVAMSVTGQHTLTLYRNYSYYVNMLGNDRVHDKLAPNVHESENVGSMAWSVTESTYQGKPCKLFQADSTWRFYIRKPDTTRQWFSPKIYVIAHIDPDGKLLRTQTSYAGYMEPVQVTSVYHDDKIVATVTKGRDIQVQEIYPNESLNPFNDLFKPLFKDGVMVNSSHEFNIINPYNGTPLQVKLSTGRRFEGKMFGAPLQGYRVRSVTKFGEIESFVSRAGQLVRVEALRQYEGLSNDAPSRGEIDSWKRFFPSDWGKPLSEVDPDRRKFVTYMIPVMLNNPRLMVPWPYVVATN